MDKYFMDQYHKSFSMDKSILSALVFFEDNPKLHKKLIEGDYFCATIKEFHHTNRKTNNVYFIDFEQSSIENPAVFWKHCVRLCKEMNIYESSYISYTTHIN